MKLLNRSIIKINCEQAAKTGGLFLYLAGIISLLSKYVEKGERGISMNVKLALNQIDNVVGTLIRKNPYERLVSYSIITTILNRLDDIAKEKTIPNYKTYKHELMWSCEAICGLDEGNNHEDGKHIVWAISAVEKLKSVHCFNVDNKKIK